MANDIQYTSNQLQQIDQLKSYVEEYCNTQGIDSKLYTAYLDNKASVDPKIFEDPVFQAYWQLAFLQLMEIVNPTQIYSLSSEVGEVDFETLYSRTDAETITFMKNLMMDNPELMALAADMDTNSKTSSQEVYDLLNQIISTKSETNSPAEPLNEAEEADFDYTDTEARRLKQEFGLGDMWDWMVDTEEGIKSTENYLLAGLAEMDQQLISLKEALSSGKISAQEFDADFQSISQYRGFYLALIQQLEDALGNLMDMFSNLLKAQQEAMNSITRNLSVSA